MRTVEVQLLEMARKHWPGVRLQARNEAASVSRDTRLHRFDVLDERGEVEYADGVHILTDGAGGAQVHVYPGTMQERVIEERCADFAVSQ